MSEGELHFNDVERTLLRRFVDEGRPTDDALTEFKQNGGDLYELTGKLLLRNPTQRTAVTKIWLADAMSYSPDPRGPYYNYTEPRR